nr:MAG TPA: hypothetical protein [Caudoviricetes sp.]
MANRAYSRKAPGIHREQKKTPHSLRHAGHGYFWSFARSSSSKIGCNRIYNRIIVGTSLHFDCTTSAGAGQAKVKRRAVAVLVYLAAISGTAVDVHVTILIQRQYALYTGIQVTGADPRAKAVEIGQIPPHFRALRALDLRARLERCRASDVVIDILGQHVSVTPVSDAAPGGTLNCLCH